MKYLDRTRANNFDRRCGTIQTKYAIYHGVGSSVLDVGCGIGEFTPLFLQRFKRVVGLDPEKRFLRVAKTRGYNIEYIEGWGETFRLSEKFHTISMNNLLEHVDDPVAILKNCKKHLFSDGRIIAQVPNSTSITRRLGVLMGIIDSLNHISPKEKDFYGHKRVYTLETLKKDVEKAGLKVVKSGGILYKPLPNEMLEILCLKNSEAWTRKFLDALVKFGEDRPKECAYLYVVGE